MFSVRQPWPLLLAAHRTFDAAGVAALLRACSVISFRYNVIGGLAPGDQERLYNGVAQKVATGDLRGPTDTIRALSPIYIANENDEWTLQRVANRQQLLAKRATGIWRISQFD